MMIVKKVSDLTRVSVRTLEYYDKIGLLSPTKLTDAGYRLYSGAILTHTRNLLKRRKIVLRRKFTVFKYFDTLQSLYVVFPITLGETSVLVFGSYVLFEKNYDITLNPDIKNAISHSYY